MESDPEIEQPSTEIEQPASVARQKIPRTDKQLKALEQARQRAQQVRQEKAELNRKEKEISRAQQEQAKQQRAKKIQDDYEALTREPVEEAPKKTRKPARRIIVHEVSSAEDSDDSTVDVIIPKAKREPTATELAYNATLQKMFHYQ